MLGKNFLKRVTWLVMSVYLMNCCMSVTVRAYENLLTDPDVSVMADDVIVTEDADAVYEEELSLDGTSFDETDEESLTEDYIEDENTVIEEEETAEEVCDDVTAGAEVIEEGDEALKIVPDEDYYDSEYFDEILLESNNMLVTASSDEEVIVLINLDSASSFGMELSRLKWTLLDSDLCEVPEDKYSVSLGEYFWNNARYDLSQFKQSVVLYARVEYCNPGREFGDGSNPVALCRIQLVTSGEGHDEEISFNLIEKSMNLELFKNNKLPFNCGADFEEEELLTSTFLRDGAIDSVYFEDPQVRELFFVDAIDAGMLTIGCSDDTFYDDEDLPVSIDEVNRKVAQKSYSSRIVFEYEGTDGQRHSFTTKDALTLNIKRTVPKLKAEKLVFNSFLAGTESKPVIIDGAEHYDIRDNCDQFPQGFELDGSYVSSTMDLPEKVKSGIIPIYVGLDTNEWRFPDNDFIVNIPYSVVNVAPKLKIAGSKTITLNTYVHGAINNAVYAAFDMISDKTYQFYPYSTAIICKIYDSAGNDVTTDNVMKFNGVNDSSGRY